METDKKREYYDANRERIREYNRERYRRLNKERYEANQAKREARAALKEHILAQRLAGGPRRGRKPKDPNRITDGCLKYHFRRLMASGAIEVVSDTEDSGK